MQVKVAIFFHIVYNVYNLLLKDLKQCITHLSALTEFFTCEALQVARYLSEVHLAFLHLVLPDIISQENQYRNLYEIFIWCNMCNFKRTLPQQEYEMIQLHPIQDSSCPGGLELYQICSTRDRRVLYWQRELDWVKNSQYNVWETKISCRKENSAVYQYRWTTGTIKWF